jgi:hypothetical protein
MESIVYLLVLSPTLGFPVLCLGEFPANLKPGIDPADWNLIEGLLLECGSLTVLCTQLGITDQDEMSNKFEVEFQNTTFTKITTKAKLWNNIRNLRFNPQGGSPFLIFAHF